MRKSIGRWLGFCAIVVIPPLFALTVVFAFAPVFNWNAVELCAFACLAALLMGYALAEMSERG